MIIPESEQREVLIYAFRYALGRATYCTHTMQEVIKQAWPDLSLADRGLIKREISDAGECNRLGMECDAVGWIEILDLED